MAEWISYESADAPPAEVSIDVDYDDDTSFKSAHPYVAIVTVRGFRAGDDGQPDDATADTLFELERQCEAAIAAAGGALVCTVSEDAAFTLYGYIADFSAATSLNSLQSQALRLDVRTERDDVWKHYDAYILRGEELEEARDAEQLAELEENDLLPDEPVDVAFYVEFDNGKALRDARSALRDAGYTVPEFIEDPSSDGMTVLRELVLSPEHLAAERATLQRIIAPFSGHYGGWGVDEDDLEEPDSAVLS